MSYLSNMFEMSRLAFEANWVISLRMMKFAAGDRHALREMQTMVAEKVEIAGRLAIENAFALASGKPFEAVNASTVSEYRKAVQANRRRLLRKTR